MNIFDELERADLPVGEYVVVGSAILQAHGLREAGDIDLFVTDALYEQLKKAGWKEELFPGSERPYALFQTPFDAATSWTVGTYRPELHRLISEADIIRGFPFARLEELYRWKSTCRLEKDLADLAILDRAAQSTTILSQR